MEKIKWGVLGTAGIAKGCTIPGMQLAENCNLYAIAGRSMEKAEAYKKEFGFEKAYDSYEALLADPQVEAVYIPLPNELHYEWSIKALKAKKATRVQKSLLTLPKNLQKRGQKLLQKNLQRMMPDRNRSSPSGSARKTVSIPWRK